MVDCLLGRIGDHRPSIGTTLQCAVNGDDAVVTEFSAVLYLEKTEVLVQSASSSPALR